MIYFLFIVGFVLLIQGAKWLVGGSSLVARWFGISELVIGLTIVSMGTSMPELTVNLLASFKGSADIAIGNVLGSNIANVLLILGATAAIASLPVRRSTLINEIPFSLAAALLIGFLANVTIGANGLSKLEINRIEGGIILFFFLLFIIYTYDLSKQDTLLEEAPVRDPSEKGWKAALSIAGGGWLCF
jgi:cation:H+ antiporter